MRETLYHTYVFSNNTCLESWEKQNLNLKSCTHAENRLGKENDLYGVYFQQALDLQPQDTSGLADPYLVVHLGKTKISDKDNYVPNNLNPMFGK